MKKEINIAMAVSAALMLLWFLAAAIFYRLDLVEQTPADLAKYPAMQGFFTACGEFEGGTFDVDANVMKLAFRTDRTPVECLRELDRVAESGGWTTDIATDRKRVFSKTQRRYPVDTDESSVTVSIGGDPGTMELVWR